VESSSSWIDSIGGRREGTWPVLARSCSEDGTLRAEHGTREQHGDKLFCSDPGTEYGTADCSISGRPFVSKVVLVTIDTATLKLTGAVAGSVQRLSVVHSEIERPTALQSVVDTL
jgi:hypothetical protein